VRVRKKVIQALKSLNVFYHADVPGQSLWQVEGKKRVYVYPNEAPYLKPESLESIILGEQEEEIPYERSFDDGAEVYDLKPGEMVHWPLNAALAVGWRKLNLSKSKQVVRMVDFKVDPKSKTGIADVDAFVKA